MLISKYDYPELRRIQTKKGRQYVGEDDNPVPSVTTILGDTGDKTALIAWRKRVGEAEATRISTESAGLGTKVHNALEKFILQEDYEIKGNNQISVMAKNMVNEMIEKGLVPKVDCAIFADTQSEPRAVYDWLSWLKKQLSFPVHIVTVGNLTKNLLKSNSKFIS